MMDDLAQIAQFNRTEAPFPDSVTLQQLIEAQVEASAKATAVICPHDKNFAVAALSYGQLNDKANQVARLLRAKGVGPGQIVGLMVERSFAMILGILGVLKAGGAYLPVAPELPKERIDYLLKDAAVSVFLVNSKSAGKFAFDGAVVNLDDPNIYRAFAANPPLLNRPSDLAYVIYTSGSTGKPKGVMIEHRSVINRLHWMQQAYPIGAGDVILQKTPYSFDVSVWELFWWAMAGAKLCFLAPGGEKHPLAIVETIKNYRVSVLHFVPSMLSVFLDYLESKPASVIERLISVRRVFCSGEALTASHVKKFNAIWGGKTGARLSNLYGPTEATVDVSYFDCPEHNDLEIVPIGRPINNTKFYVIKDDRPLAIGECGELCIAGAGLARGYLNNPVLTEEKFTDNPANPGERIYRTGDLARWLPDGNIEYLGREDHQVKIRGLRIELGEIENTIRGFPGIVDCVAAVHKYSESIVLIIAYWVGKADLSLDGLKLHLREQLPEYMMPQHFEQIARIPLTPSGKADRQALPPPANLAAAL